MGGGRLEQTVGAWEHKGSQPLLQIFLKQTIFTHFSTQGNVYLGRA